MIISRTPFRISLGGGSTDLPSYSRQYGGFIFGVAIKMYIDIFIRKPVIYDKIDLQYLQFESVDKIDDLKHPIGREALKLTGIDRAISVYFKSDTPIGTGLGGSGSCAVGLLNALWYHKGVLAKDQQELAEEAFQITQRLGLPDGKQDPYIGALGGFVVMEIDKDDSVVWHRPDISEETIQKFLDNSLFFYTGICRDSVEILRGQGARPVELKHRTKEIGRQTLAAFTSGNIDNLGQLMNKHWCIKKEMSEKMTVPEIDEIHEFCLKNGALGGKLVGAGGGGYLFYYCRNTEDKLRLARLVADRGMKIIPIQIDNRGSRVSRIKI